MPRVRNPQLANCTRAIRWPCGLIAAVRPGESDYLGGILRFWPG